MTKRHKPKPATLNRTASPTFPARLRARLAEIGLTQTEFAREAGITRAAAWRYVHGKTLPTAWDVRIRITDALEVSEDWIDQ